MQKYVNQLLADIDMAILQRWRSCPPHYWQFGVTDPWLVLPDGLGEEEEKAIREEAETKEYILNGNLEASHREGEKYLEERPRETMFDHFSIKSDAFPPAEKLTARQLEHLVAAIRRLWATFNFTASLPENAPARIIYPLLLARMNKPAMLMEFGVTGIEFCDYEPLRCPFGEVYCSCKELSI